MLAIQLICLFVGVLQMYDMYFKVMMCYQQVKCDKSTYL